jgi:hypothetical protein
LRIVQQCERIGPIPRLEGVVSGVCGGATTGIDPALPVGKEARFSEAYRFMSCPMDRRLDSQVTELACALAFPSAGRRMEINNAIIAITTRSSTNVKPALFSTSWLVLRYVTTLTTICFAFGGGDPGRKR